MTDIDEEASKYLVVFKRKDRSPERRQVRTLSQRIGLEDIRDFIDLQYYRGGHMAIHPKFNKLITALRTAIEKGDGTLNKEATVHDDLFDAFRMSLLFWH